MRSFRTSSFAVLGVLGALGALGCAATPAAESPAAVLPLKTVRLYETGVAYFERAGKIEGRTSALPVPASHVDDALKTMIVLSSGSSKVDAVEFESLVSRGLARSLAALPQDSDQALTYRDVLRSMTGAEVEIETNDGSIVGQMVEVVEAPPIPLDGGEKAGEDEPKKPGRPRVAADTENDFYLAVFTSDGAVKRFRASRVKSVRPTDPSLAAKLAAAVGTLSDRAAQVSRSLRVLGASSEAVRIGYIAETPVWRSTYRLVLEPGSDDATLQGWALLHNDTDEAWSGVTVELVNGRPDSFLFPLSAPRYARRPLAEPAETLSTVPQLADKTPDQIWGDHVDGVGTGTGYGFGSGHGRLGGSHSTRAPSVRMGMTQVTTGESDELGIGNLADVAQSTGTEAGALFSYRLQKPLDLRSHGSALVPFASGKVKARRITWFATPGERGRSAARLTNTTTQTLPAGPIAIYEPTGFAGETGVDRLKPRERAFMQFGIDLDVELELENASVREEVRKVELENGALTEHFVRHHERTYEITSRSATERTAYLVLDVVKNSKVDGVDETDFDPSSNVAFAVFRVAAGAKGARVVKIEEGLKREAPMTELTSKRLNEIAEEAQLPSEHRTILRQAATLLVEAEKLVLARATVDKEVVRLEEDIERVRKHLEALGDKSGSPAGANPLVTRILDLEDQMAKLRRKLETLADERDTKLDLVRKELEKLAPPAIATPAPPGAAVPAKP